MEKVKKQKYQCPECNCDIEEGYEFCSSCGIKLKQVVVKKRIKETDKTAFKKLS